MSQRSLLRWWRHTRRSRLPLTMLTSMPQPTNQCGPSAPAASTPGQVKNLPPRCRARIVPNTTGAGLFSRSSTRSDCTIHKVRRSRTVLLLSQRSSPNGRLCWRLVFRRSRSHAESRCDSQTVLRGSHEQASSLQVLASSCETPPISGMGDTGLEPVTPSLSSWCSNQLS